jgi:hypothetical protein
MKDMLLRKLRHWMSIGLIVISMLTSLSACNDHGMPHRKKPHGKIKKGGRIPCPIKDC